MRALIFIILLFLLTSCEVFKQRTKSSSTKERETYSQIDINHEKDLEKLTHINETITIRNDGDYFTEIKPRGPFTIGPDGSFSGEAESVTIRGNKSEQREESRQINESERDNSNIRESTTEKDYSLEEEKSKTVDIQKKTSIKGYIGAGIAVLIIIIGLALAWKYKII